MLCRIRSYRTLSIYYLLAQGNPHLVIYRGIREGIHDLQVRGRGSRDRGFRFTSRIIDNGCYSLLPNYGMDYDLPCQSGFTGNSHLIRSPSAYPPSYIWDLIPLYLRSNMREKVNPGTSNPLQVIRREEDRSLPPDL